MKKIFNKYKRRIWTMVIVIIVIVIDFISILITKGTMNNKLELTYYISQIVTSVFLIGGGIIGVWQYYLSKKTENNQLKLVTIQKSIDLSEYYKDNILTLYAALFYVYEKSNIYHVLRKIDVSKMNNFDQIELNTLLNDNDKKELKEIQESNEFHEIVIKANLIYRLNLNVGQRTIDIEKVNDEGKKVIRTICLDVTVASFYTEIVEKLLNNLEYFALHFEHGTADESSVYQSLHQTYIRIVQDLYYNISESNKEPNTLYYTNIVGLYKKWHERKSQKDKEIVHKARLCHEKGNTVDKIID